MARKTTGTSGTTRSKKNATSVSPVPVQAAPEVRKEVSKEVPKNGKSATAVSANFASSNVVPVNLDDEIRHRAYQLYLQRQATAGNASGDENQDWLMAENEVRSRYGKLARHTTA
jgi:hypothetical protein